MRMMPSRYIQPAPAQIKKQPSQIAHMSAPLKGLNLASKTTAGDPLTATVLTNFVVDDDRITLRGGYRKKTTIAGSLPIWCLVPWHGTAPKLLAATASALFNAETGASVKTGFTSGDWHWTAFSNLSQQDYTVMVNGADGVWSWDGLVTAGVDYAAVAVTSLSNTSPARCTVAAGDIAKFYEGQIVLIAGADTAHAAANGYHAISSVNSPANTFALVGVDLTSAPGAQTVGVTADPPGSGIIKEAVTAPATEPWISVNLFNIVCAHMNRLFFADNANLAVYYLPLQQKSGVVKVLPLNALFKRGGTIKAMYTWSVDGGVGIDDMLVVFSSNGECVIYQGTDPDSTFTLKGVFRFDAPMSKHSIVNYGGELYVLISTGLVPMSTLMKAESEQLGLVDKSVISFFREHASAFHDTPGWQAILNPQSGRMFCNIPHGAPNQYHQMIRDMAKPVWSEFEGIPARCWAWLYPYMWFADDQGHIYQGHTSFLNDDGQPIRCDVQLAWTQLKTPAIKHFKLVQVYYTSDGEVKPAIDVKVDYDFSDPQNVPDVTFQQPGAVWDTATWDVDYWAGGPVTTSAWNGIGRLGRVGAIRLKAAIQDCEFSITGFDLTYETGAIL